MKTVVIYLGGLGPELAPEIEGEVSATIAADSGLHLADKHGVEVNLIVGDMDSVDAALLNKYESSGSHVARFDHEKDETDFELALMAAGNYVADHLLVIGGGGNRLDHLIANFAVASGPLTKNWDVTMITKNETVHVVRPGSPSLIFGQVGSPIAIVPFGGSATLSSQGVKWELNESTLGAHTARGISNEFSKSEAKFESHSGAILAIVPN